MTTKPFVFVLGMHRSGTSCLAGCLEHCGLHLGDVRVGHDALQEEAVELCLGERVRALHLDRVDGRQHEVSSPVSYP